MPPENIGLRTLCQQSISHPAHGVSTRPSGSGLWKVWLAPSSLMASNPTENRPDAPIAVVTQACAVGLKVPPTTVVLRLRNTQPKAKGGASAAPAALPVATLTRCVSSGKQVVVPPVGGEMLSSWKQRSAGCSCSSKAVTSDWLSGNHPASRVHGQAMPLVPVGVVLESRQTMRSG